MIGYEDFGNEVEAHLRWLLDADLDEVERGLRRRLQDGSWRRAPRQFASTLLVRLGRAGGDGLRVVRAEVAAYVMQQELDDPARTVLEAFALGSNGFDAAELAAVAVWLAGVATPGDASLVASIFDSTHGAEERAAVAPLAAWLVDHGAAELRARRSHMLVFGVLRSILARRDDERTLPAVRYVLATEGQLPTWFARTDRDWGADVLIAGIERALEIGSASTHLVADLARALPDRGGGAFLGEIASSGQFPRVTAALTELLLAGALSPDSARDAWPRVFAHVHPPADAVLAHGGVDVAMEALWKWVSFGKDGRGHELHGTPENDRAWARLVVASALSHGTARPGITAAERVQRLLGRRDAVDDGARQAIRAHVLSLEHATDLMRRLAEQPTRGAMAALLGLLADSPSPRAEVDAQPFLDATMAAVTRLLQSPAAGCVVHLRGLDRARLGTLANQDKVARDATTLVVDRHELSGLARLDLPFDDQIIVGTLYVIHEVVHLDQGIGDKATVTTLRGVGAESTLMQLDLAADHLAAMVVAPACARAVTYLKDLQGRSLTAFPVTAYSSIAARARKSNRLVGLRFDAAARRLGMIAADADEHVFCDHGPAGGAIVILASGPPVRVVGVASLTRGDAETLARAADGQRPLARIDAIAERCLRSVPLRGQGGGTLAARAGGE